jgi:hypothetical protein
MVVEIDKPLLDEVLQKLKNFGVVNSFGKTTDGPVGTVHAP